MKKLVLAIFSLLVLLPAQKATAQQTEVTREEINTLLSQGRFYDLYHISHLPQSFTFSNFDQQYMWAMSSSVFNDYSESISGAITIFNEYSDQLDSNTSAILFNQVLNSLVAIEEYQEAADWMTNNLDVENLELYNEALKYCLSMISVPKMEVSYVNHDVIIPIEFLPVENGELITLEAVADGQSERFIFDTQASDNLVDEAYAKRHNLTIIQEEVPATGLSDETIICKWAYGKDINIGGIVIKNPTYVISPVPLEYGMILGQDVISRLKEIHIKPMKGEILVPGESQMNSNGLRNLMFYDDEYYVCLSSEVPAGMIFNTACVRTTMNYNFFRQHEQYIKENVTPITTKLGSYKSAEEHQVYPISSIDASINQMEYQIKDVLVDDDPEVEALEYCLGELGVNFVKQCKLVSINFEKMLFDIEM